MCARDDFRLEWLLADDWEIEEETFTITRTQAAAAYEEATMRDMKHDDERYYHFMLALGIDPGEPGGPVSTRSPL